MVYSIPNPKDAALREKTRLALAPPNPKLFDMTMASLQGCVSSMIGKPFACGSRSSISKKGSRAKVPTDNFHALLEHLGIKTAHKVFYSFRHGIIEQMTGAKGVHPDWSRDYTGHWPQDVHKREYGLPGFVEVLKREMTDKIKFDDVNLEPLKRYKDRDWKLAELVAEFEGRREAYHETVERNRPAAERRAAIREEREARMAALVRRRQRGKSDPS